MSNQINLNYFFDGSCGFNLGTSAVYKKNFKKCLDAASTLDLEIKNQSNEIINSFSIDYQKKIKLKKSQLKIKNNLLVIGMGGSSAGTKALNGLSKKNISFFDNYDPVFISEYFKKNNLNNYTIFVISKSGYTFETLAMFNLTYQHLLSISKKDVINKNIVVIVENTNNPLYALAKKMDFKIIEHNKDIGGRYSVFSETSMLLFDFEPILVASSAEKILAKLTKKNSKDHNSPIVNAALIMTLKEMLNIKFNINILYDYSLKNLSYWYHQLFSESLGKNDLAITPMTSICPKDHHSMMQLFIDGPRDKLFNIFTPEISSHFENFEKLDLGVIEKIKPDNLLKLQFNGLIKTFNENKIPHRIISIGAVKKNKNYNLLEFMAYNIIETIILAYAQNINPYDQPAVEQIKKNTFNI